MIVNTITEAKAQLSALIERVLAGDEVLIKRAGKPVVILTKYESHAVSRVPGAFEGKIRIANDFDELPEDIATAFGTK